MEVKREDVTARCVCSVLRCTVCLLLKLTVTMNHLI